jgi:hypothetical protein
MLTVTLENRTYDITRKNDMRELALAMRAAGLDSVDAYLDGRRFSALSLRKAELSGGLITEIG